MALIKDICEIAQTLRRQRNEQFALDLGVPATSDAPPPALAMPDPGVLGPVAERFGIEVVGPPWRVAHP